MQFQDKYHLFTFEFVYLPRSDKDKKYQNFFYVYNRYRVGKGVSVR